MPTRYKGSPEQVLALDTYIKFTRALNSLESRLARSPALKNLTGTQFGVLEALLHLGPMSQSEIGSKLLKSGGNITLVVDNLEKCDLVLRQSGLKDRRVTTVSLTDKGKEMIEAVFPSQVEAIVKEFGVLTAEEQKTLGQLCKKLGKRDK
jgi:MarR family 2-MHQ and catechol resistance regulon transcriptional repressor